MDSKKILKANVEALMIHRYGKINLNKTHLESKARNKDMAISIGSLQRLLDAVNSTGIDVVDKIAYFFDMQSWQLLSPVFDASNPPAIKQRSKTEDDLYEKLMKAAEDLEEYKTGK